MSHVAVETLPPIIGGHSVGLYRSYLLIAAALMPLIAACQPAPSASSTTSATAPAYTAPPANPVAPAPTIATGDVQLGPDGLPVEAPTPPGAPISVRALVANPTCCGTPGSNLVKYTAAAAGLSVDWGPPTPGASIAMTTALNGQEDIVEISGSGAIATAGTGQPSRVFALASNPGMYSGFALQQAVAARLEAAGVMPNSPLADRMHALKGLTIFSNSAGGPIEISFRSAFQEFGMNADTDVTFQPGAQQVGDAAWRSGQVDVYQCCDPRIFSLVPNAVAWVQPGEIDAFKNGYQGVWATSLQYGQNNPEAIKRFVDALKRARDLMVAATPGSKAREVVLHDLDDFNPDVDPEVIAASFDYNRPNNTLPPVPLNRTETQRMLDSYNVGSPTKVSLTPDDIILPGFLVD
jgi:ABC-type nitrate/sulfonate/bicarbonate transport system substrate-binding protein